MDHFDYRAGILHAEDVALPEIAPVDRRTAAAPRVRRPNWSLRRYDDPVGSDRNASLTELTLRPFPTVVGGRV